MHNLYDFKFLKNMENQSEELCWMAIDNHVSNLQYIHNPTKEMCLRAVNFDRSSIKWVPDKYQTEDFCLKILQTNKHIFPY